MKLFRDNKYAKKITKNLSAVLASSIILSGCASNVNVVDINPIVEPTNNITIVEPTVVPTPEPAPEPTPEPTPFIRTTYEVPNNEYIQEEIEKLCVIDDNEKYFAYNYVCMLFEKNGEQKATCVMISEAMDSTNSIVVTDAFTNTDLFSFSRSDFIDDPNSSTYAEDIEKIDPINPYFEDVKVIKLHMLWFRWYYDITKQYFSDEARKAFVAEITNYDESTTYDTAKARYTRQEVAYFYVKYLPEEYRINAYDLFPELEHDRKALGAKTGRE